VEAAAALQFELLQVHEASCKLPPLPALLLLRLLVICVCICSRCTTHVWQQRQLPSTANAAAAGESTCCARWFCCCSRVNCSRIKPLPLLHEALLSRSCGCCCWAGCCCLLPRPLLTNGLLPWLGYCTCCCCCWLLLSLHDPGLALLVTGCWRPRKTLPHQRLQVLCVGVLRVCRTKYWRSLRLLRVMLLPGPDIGAGCCCCCVRYCSGWLLLVGCQLALHLLQAPT
jgi:hypothetical protein